MTVTPLRIVWLIVSALFYLILAYTVPRQQFGLLIGLLAGLFVGYGFIVIDPVRQIALSPKQIEQEKMPALSPSPLYKERGPEGKVNTDPFLFTSAILFRILLLFAIPSLSDDFYRFVWDGRLLVHGFNPYLYLPDKLIGTEMAATAGLDETLFRQLNSPGYFTVYPPLNQALFGLGAWLSNGDLLWNAVWLRVPILLSEVGSLWLMTKLLRRFNMNPNRALLYSLNPLVILELTGNIHFEAVMIFFTLLAGWWLASGRLVASAGALALAIGAKLLPLILLPLVVRYLPWRRALIYVIVMGGLVLMLFVPFANLELIRNVFSSINLYFQKFEFNASIYYVLRTIGYWIRGYNTIRLVGFWLSIVTLLSILWIAFRWRNAVANQLLASLIVYFAFATTVHPWYITSLVAATVFTRFRFPIVWSALIPLSYFTYRTLPYQENLWLTTLEYGIVAIVVIAEVWVYRYPKKNFKSSRSSAF